MDRIKTILTIAAVATTLSACNVDAQIFKSASFTSGGSGIFNGGGAGMFNAGGNGLFNGRKRLLPTRSEWDAFKAHAEIVRQRNEAWPKPFQCHDRQCYFATFYPMYQRGYEIQSTLTDAHFEKDSNELNSAGKQKIAGIMQNLPVQRRQIFVFEQGDDERTHARVAAVKVAVNEWFGHMNPPTVLTTARPAHFQSGLEIQQFNQNFLGALPQPGIAIGGGGGGGAGAGTGGGN